MGKPTTIEPHYNLTHAFMIGVVKTIFDLFVIDKPDFVIYDPDFDDPFEANWQNDIDEAEDFDSDETVLDQQRQLTEAVEQKMNECRHKYQFSKRFIEKVFSDNKAVLDEFGYDNYGEVSYKQLEMILFMKLFHNAADKYKVQLLAVNYTQPMIDEILILHDELDTDNREQEAFIKKRKTITRNRQIAYNKIWDTMVDVCKAGQSIYHDNAAKYEQYLIPSSGGGSTPEPQITITMATNQTVPDKVNMTLLGGDGEEVTADYGNNTTETKTTNSINHIIFSVLYSIAGNYVIKLMGNVAGFLELFVPDAKLTAINLPEGINLFALDLLNNLLTSFFLPLSCINMINLQLNNNALDQQSVNQILIQLAANGLSNGMVNLAGGTNAAPSGQGIAAMNQLIARGWTVVTN